jgi:hypothetical protein
MPWQNLYVGLDVSTTAAKAVVIEAGDAKYAVVARGQHAFKPLQTHADHPGRAEQVSNCIHDVRGLTCINPLDVREFERSGLIRCCNLMRWHRILLNG